MGMDQEDVAAVAFEPLQDTDLVLLMLAAPTRIAAAREQVDGILRLEKLVFLALKESGNQLPEEVALAYDYYAYHFGPYSKQVYEAVDVLEEAALLTEAKELGADTLDELEEVQSGAADRQGVKRHFSLTEDGKAVANLLAGQHPEVVEALSHIKDEYGNMPLRQLIRYVYSKYPEYTSRSKILDEL
jgi:uncharacterized protein